MWLFWTSGVPDIDLFIYYSFLLTFAYAEALEIKKDFAEVHAVYENFLSILRANLETLKKQTEETAPPTNPSSTNNNGNGNGPGQANASAGELSNNQNSQSSFFSQSDERPRHPQATELQKHRTEYGLVWIMYMRFAMRAEGVKPSRAVFGKARKDPWTPWEVFEASGAWALFYSIPFYLKKGMCCAD